MIAELVWLLAHVGAVVDLAAPIVQASGDDEAPLWLLAAGPAGAAGTYFMIYRYYRNTDKSHAFERDTFIEAQPVQGGEEKINHISRTRDSDIDGDNSSAHRKRVQRVQRS